MRVVFRKIFNCLSGSQKLENKTDWTQMSNQEQWYQESHFWAPSTNKHKIHWDSAEYITYSTNYQQLLTLESWYTNLVQEPLNWCQQLPAPYKQLIHDLKQKLHTSNNNRQIKNNSKTTTNQSLQLSHFDNQSHHDKTDQSKPRPESPDDDSSLDSEDDYHSGSRNVSHPQQSF